MKAKKKPRSNQVMSNDRLEAIRKGIVGYQHERSAMLRLLKKRGSFSEEDFDLWLKRREFRRPIRFSFLEGDTFILEVPHGRERPRRFKSLCGASHTRAPGAGRPAALVGIRAGSSVCSSMTLRHSASDCFCCLARARNAFANSDDSRIPKGASRGFTFCFIGSTVS